MTHKYLLMTLIGSVLLTAALTILQIWFNIIGWDNFMKAIGTLAIVFVLVGFLMVVGHDFGSKKKLKDENYLD